MERFYYNLITFLGQLSPIMKILIVGLLTIFVILTVVDIVKTHVNKTKPVFKPMKFIVLAILVAITIFLSIHMF